MQTSISKYILAVVTDKPELVQGGGAPVFIARDEAERERIAVYLARINEAVVHDLENGVFILVKH